MESERWHVRNEQGKVFGPVDFETLKAWACDGRLSPTNEVSSNGTDWKLATSIRALDMDWVAEVTPGTFYGPIHRGAMADLIREGSISAQSAFFVRRGMGDVPVQTAQTDGQLGQLCRLTDEIAALRQQVAGGGLPVQHAQGLAEELKQALASQGEQARLQAEAAAAQFEQLRQQLGAQSEQARRRLVVYEEQVTQLRQQAASLEEQANQSRRQALAAEEHLRITVQQLAEQTEQAGTAQRQWSARVESQAAEMEKLRRERAESEARASALHEEQVTGLKQSLADAQAALLTANRRCASLESAAQLAAHSPSGFEASLAKVGDEVKSVRQLLASLGEQLDRREQVRLATPPVRVVERVEAEPLEAEVLPPKRPQPSSPPPEAERMAAERVGGGRAADVQPPPNTGRTSAGLSLAELEQQARRELERLGAQGATLFKKKR